MHSVRMSRRKRALTNCAAEHGSRVSVHRRHVPHIDRRGDFLVFFFFLLHSTKALLRATHGNAQLFKRMRILHLTLLHTTVLE